MESQYTTSKEAVRIRQKVESLLKKATKASVQFSEAEMLRLIHELEVHQIELELQNEELALEIANAQDAIELFDFAPSGFFTLSKEGDILRLNITSANMLGKQRPLLLTCRLSLFVSDDTKPVFNHFLAQVFQSNIKEFCEVTLMVNENSSLYVYLTGIISSNGEHCLVTLVDITQRKQAELELIKAKESAEESDRLKTAFLQNMNHEIRTPMNAIMGFSNLLVKHINNKTKLEQYSTIINDRCLDLLTTIDDVLDIAKIQSGQLTLYIESCNIPAFFNDLAHFFKEHQKRINKKHIKLTLQSFCDQANSSIEIDKGKLEQIFIHLIDNAFKFTEIGEIMVGCYTDMENNIVFYVSDTGIGIPYDKQSLIFEPFTQISQGNSRLYGGTGLGLSIVKGLINLLNGNIWIESQPDKGSTFYLSFPFKKLESLQTISLAADVAEEYHFSNKTILIVEDDYYNMELLKIFLEDTGITVLHAESGLDAIKIVINSEVDLVLMDIRMSDMDGYEATRQIRQYKPDLVIIAQTAFATSSDKHKALISGCNDYISKPIKQEVLLSKIKYYLVKINSPEQNHP